MYLLELQFVIVVQSLSCVQLFETPWTAVHQTSLSFTISWSLLKLMSIESVMPSNHLILCCPLLLLPSTFPSIRVFSNELTLPILWPKYCTFSFSISPSNGYSGLISLDRNGYPLQYSGLENSSIVHGLTKSRARLSDSHFTSFRIDWCDLFAVQGHKSLPVC